MTKNPSAPLRTSFLAGFPFFLLALLLALFFHDIIFMGKTLSTSSLLPGTSPSGPYGFTGHRPAMPFSFDTAGDAWVNEPNPYVIRNVLSKGGLPSWSPYEGLGMPLIGNLNTEVFNPLKAFLNLCPGPFSQDMFFLLRILVMGVFTYLFLREKKLSVVSCLLGSSFFMLSGYSVWWINLHPLSTVVYLPAVFFFYERWSGRKDLKSAFLMSLSLSFAIVSGKIPDVIMGVCLLFLYAVWKGFPRSMFREGAKVILVTSSAALMAAVALLPFLELYANASPFAKALRTGSAGHTLPLITSASLVQPMFLGWHNYLYGSWLKWTPQTILPHAGEVVLVLALYAVLNSVTLKKSLPFLVFSSLLFLTVYGILPAHVITRLPVIGSIGFLKYNAMFYFSLAVISAHSLDHLLSEDRSGKRFGLSMGIASLIIFVCFFSLHRECPPGTKLYITAVLMLSLCALIVIGAAFRITQGKWIFGALVFSCMVFELFLYMPKDHPDRTDPYRRPPYLDLITEKTPYRFIGDGSSVPPLVSNAMGLYDVRSINVLFPEDYYIFFQNLLSYSATQANSPETLFAATSPFLDLAGVKYVAGLKPLAYRQLEDRIQYHVASMRWVRLFDAMIDHTIKGGATYGPFTAGGEERFSFFFPTDFVLRTKIRVTEPFLFAGLALKDFPDGTPAGGRISVEKETSTFPVEGGRWNDRWMDVSPYMGRVVTVVIEGKGAGAGNFALGDFGLSPGYERERAIYDNLLALHKRETDFLEYKGEYEGLHIYENRNVMERAFIVHKVKSVGGIADVVRELQEGTDFRETGLVTGNITLPPTGSDGAGDKVVIRKYAPDEVAIEADSKGGLLVLSDLYYPGWKVRVNGRDEGIIKAFGLMRGVVVGNGKSDVLFYYRPLSLYAGGVVSLVTIILWISFLAMSGRKAGLR